MFFMGLDFRRMDDQDYMGLAGADPNSWICERGPFIVVVDDARETITVFEGERELQFARVGQWDHSRGK